MARIRTIKPEFWASEDIAAVCRDARLLFIGLLNFADDSGNGPASPKGLMMKVFPGDSDVSPAKIEKWLDELDQELIGLYEAEGKQYYHVMKWDHQRINRPQDAKYPPFTERSRNSTGTLPPDSIVKDRIGLDRIVKDSIDQTAFDQFWAEYPRKVGKQKCQRWWAIYKPDNLEQMLSTIGAFKLTEQWQDSSLVPHPITWLHRGGWDDEAPKPKGLNLYVED